MIDDQVDHITQKRVDSREDVEVNLPNAFHFFLQNYDLNHWSAQILYQTKRFRFGH